jgi:enoyl-CoA hydratase
MGGNKKGNARAVMPFETIVVERPEPRIARIVMNRPEARNAQNLQMTYDLNAAFDQIQRDTVAKMVLGL